VKMSLVLSTVGRTAELERFLKALAVQTFREVELILIDQNPDDRLQKVIESYQDPFPLRHLRSARGLSKGRNVGLGHVTGDIVVFPDDDCWYPPDLLMRVCCRLLEHREWDGLTIHSAHSPESKRGGHWGTGVRAGLVTRYNVWQRGTSYTIFLRRQVVERVGQFDESLGVGAGTPWGSCEEMDYLLRALDLGFQIFYDPDFIVYHPGPIQACHATHQVIAKSYAYALGRGRAVRMRGYPMWFVIAEWARPLGVGLVHLLRGRLGQARVHWAASLGRMQGWLGRV
jgi:glycosyltransferase involved in cell wall biosynthesis